MGPRGCADFWRIVFANLSERYVLTDAQHSSIDK